MKEQKANKKIIIISVIVLIAIIAAVITVAAVSHNGNEKTTASATLPAINPDEESTSATVTQTTTTTTTKQSTTKKKTENYSIIETALGEYAFHFKYADMKFRGSDGKIYYADGEENASIIYRFDPENGKNKKYIEIPSAKTYGSTYRTLVKLCEKGVIVEYCSDDALEGEVIPDYHFFARAYKGKKDISKNVNEYSNEFNGEKIYIANNEDSSIENVDIKSSGDREFSFRGFMYLPSELNEYYLEQVFTADDEVFGIFIGGSKYNKYQLVKIENSERVKVIGEISKKYYITDKEFFFCKDNKLYSINLKSDDFKLKKVTDLNCDILYFVTKNRAYYCIHQKNGLASIYYIDLKTEKIYRVATSSNRKFEY